MTKQALLMLVAVLFLVLPANAQNNGSQELFPTDPHAWYKNEIVKKGLAPGAQPVSPQVQTGTEAAPPAGVNKGQSDINKMISTSLGSIKPGYKGMSQIRQEREEQICIGLLLALCVATLIADQYQKRKNATA